MSHAALRYLCALLSLAALAGCDRKRPQQAAEQPSQESIVPRTDIEGLEHLINLPYRPTATKWATEKFAKGDDWGLTVLLTLSKDDIQALLARAEVLPNCHATVRRELVRTWFPQAAREELHVDSKTDGDRVAVEAVCIRPTPFTMPEKSPAIQGDGLVFEKQGLVLLELFTM